MDVILIFLFILLWFLLGFIGVVLHNIKILRGISSYDYEDIVNSAIPDINVIFIFLGIVSFSTGIISFIYEIINNKLLKGRGFIKSITYLIYKICNIGVKTKE